MKLRRIALVPVLATIFVALVGCGGGKSSNANSANSAASRAVATAAGMASGLKAGAMGAMQNAGTQTGAMGSEAVPNCGAVQAVWVNLKTKVYHEPGDPAYGKTVHGKYLCPSQARAQGFRPAGGAMTTQHHHSTSYSQ